jgi:transposase InsO family protein
MRRSQRWLRLGIQHQRIQPAHPEQNGAHERMHKTLKAVSVKVVVAAVMQSHDRCSDPG